ncbi:methionyl-tRNA synthetase [Pseudohyphozyma bogoriensis]|nr:methionyl-tRNA synthetase [Pseudohyphozyma bogoriensis]
MASPFPVIPEASATRKIRPGAELRDYRKDRDDGKILPKTGERNVLVTSALPYVNNQPHLGNIIGSTLSADVFARYNRQRNIRVLYICGTDEYGTTTEVMAAKENLSPQAICDKYHKLHADAYEWFQIGFDHFGRTSSPEQTEICQHIFLKLYQNGWLEEKENEQLYCEKDKRFLADRYIRGTCPQCGYEKARGDQCENCSATYESTLELLKPSCSACGTTPTLRTTAHLHIKLADLEPKIKDFVAKASSEGVWSANCLNLTNGWIKMGLKSRGMTRDLEWGVKLPSELGEKWANKVMYVWFDAPIGYPSITKCYTENWKEWWQNPENVKLHQFMGKDNVPFHTVLFPSYLMGTEENWTMLDSISTTEYLQYENAKFSKSDNIGVFGSNAKETGVPASVWRYYLLLNRPETNDYEFTWDEFVGKNNSELLNNFGNFVNRMLKFVNAKYDSVLADPRDGQIDETKAYEFADEDKPFVEDIDRLLKQYIGDMDQQKIRSGLATVMQISARGNQYIQENHVDNALLASNPKRCAEVVLLTINLIYTISALVHPFMPSTSDEIIAQLDATPRSIPDNFGIDIFPGHKIGKAAHLFTRIDPKNIPIWRTQFGGNKDKPAEPVLSKKQQEKAKKAAAKALLEAQGPRTQEQLALDDLIKAQGDKVREVKNGSTEGGDLAGEVAKLQDLKQQLKEVTDRLAAAKVSDHLFLKVINLLSFFFFFGTGLYSSLNPNGHHGGKVTYFTPASYVFYVWTIIDLLLLGYVIYQFFDASHDSIHGVGWRFALVAILNSIFLHVFVTGHYIVAFIFAILVASTVSNVYYTLKIHHPPHGALDAVFVHLPFSLWHAWSIVTLILSAFAAFTHGGHNGHPGVAVKVLVVIAEAFLASLAWGYAFSSRKGDLAGAAVLVYTLWGIYDFQTSSKLIHYFGLGAFIVSLFALVKSLYFTFQGDSVASTSDERAPLVG